MRLRSPEAVVRICHPAPQVDCTAVRLLPQSFTTIAAVEVLFRKMRARPSVPAKTHWRELPFCVAAAEKNGGTLSPALRPARTPVKKFRVGLKKAASEN